MKIRGLRFERLDNILSEGYDVFDFKNDIVGYVRLKKGRLTCEYVNTDFEIIYDAIICEQNLNFFYLNFFQNESQRKFHLNRIAEIILERMSYE